MSDLHNLNPDVRAAELAYRREQLSDRGATHPLPRWRSRRANRTVRGNR